IRRCDSFVQRGQSAPIAIGPGAEDIHTHTNALSLRYRPLGTRQSHSSSQHTRIRRATRPELADRPITSIRTDLKLTSNLRRALTSDRLRCSSIIKPSSGSARWCTCRRGCGLMPTSGDGIQCWMQHSVHWLCTSRLGELFSRRTASRHEPRKITHKPFWGELASRATVTSTCHNSNKPSRRRFSRRTLRFRISVVYGAQHNRTFALGLSLTSKLLLLPWQKSHVSSCCGLELICAIIVASAGMLFRRSSVSSRTMSRRRSAVTRCSLLLLLLRGPEKTRKTHTHTHASREVCREVAARRLLPCARHTIT
ncbi:unnamed protein product, partial [Trichogramma brassicae]